MKQNRSQFFRKCAGMTLPELMIASTLGAVVIAMAAVFLVQGVRYSLKTQSVSENELIEWGIYSHLTIDSRAANGMAIYANFLPASYADSTKRLGDEKRGNFLVLSCSSNKTGAQKPYISSLICYLYSEPTPGAGTFKRCIFTVPTSEQQNTLEKILNDHYNEFGFSTVADSLTAPNGSAFVNRSTKLKSAVLNLQVTKGSSVTKTSSSKLIETAFYVRG
ncbi:MAG: prepilin-type N-terminal cleavage/methylation domain-containing protein [Nibricoccus sp.]